MSERRTLLPKHRTSLSAEEEVINDTNENKKESKKYILYFLLFVVVGLGIWLFSFYLPNKFIPDTQELSKITKVGDIGIELKPLNTRTVKKIDLQNQELFLRRSSRLEKDNSDRYALESREDAFKNSKKRFERLILIGDVHGLFKPLLKLLKKIKYRSDNDKVLLLGDFIAKGKDSLKVLDFIIKNKFDCVLGNHEYYVLQNYASFHSIDRPQFEGDVQYEDDEADQFSNGVDESVSEIDPEFLLAKSLQPHHVSYINHCPLISHLGDVPKDTEDNPHHTQTVPGFAVHAGLQWNLQDDLNQQRPFSCLEMRSVLKPFYNETTDDPDTPNSVAWSKIWNEAQEGRPDPMAVFYGHDAGRGLKIKSFSKGLDSGCVKGGSLTAAVMWREYSPLGEIVSNHDIVSVSC